MALALVLVVVSGCDGGPATSTDGGPDVGQEVVIAPPALPVLTPCPTGWREVSGEAGVTLCDPWPETGRVPDCAADEAHFPGEPGCVRVGTACPADGWPADLPVGPRILYVDDDAAPGGDGLTRATALDTLTAAAAAAGRGDVIAVATGHYDEFFLSGDATIVGACTSGTVLTSSVRANDDAVVWLVNGGNVVRNLTIDAAERTAVVVDGGATATFEDVVVSSPRLSAFFVFGTLTLDGVVIRDVRPNEGGFYGRGIDLHANAFVTATRLVVERTHDGAIVATEGPCTMDLSDVSVFDVAVEPSGASAEAFSFISGCTGTIRRAVTEAVDRTTLYVDGAGTHVDASDLVVRAPRATGRTLGVLSIAAVNGGSVSLERVQAFESVVGAIFAHEPGSAVVASDVVVTDMIEDASGNRGFALVTDMAASLEVHRALVVRAIGAAVFADGAGTRLDATDLTVLDTRSRSADGFGGFAIVSYEGSAVTLARARVERPQSGGLLAALGASLDGTDVVVADVRTDDAGDFPALGAYADDHAVLALHRASISQTLSAAVAADEQSSIVLEGVSVSRVDPPVCAASSCPELGAASGLVADRGSSLSAVGFTVSDVETCGVIVGAAADDGTAPSMDLSQGLVAHAPIGACVQFAGFDPERLHHDVRFDAVDVPLQATSYTLPRVSGSF